MGHLNISVFVSWLKRVYRNLKVSHLPKSRGSDSGRSGPETHDFGRWRSPERGLTRVITLFCIFLQTFSNHLRCKILSNTKNLRRILHLKHKSIFLIRLTMYFKPIFIREREIFAALCRKYFSTGTSPCK